MSKEKETYRDNLERLDKAYPGKEMLNISEVCAYLGRSYNYVRPRYPFKDGSITKATLARHLA